MTIDEMQPLTFVKIFDFFTVFGVLLSTFRLPNIEISVIFLEVLVFHNASSPGSSLFNSQIVYSQLPLFFPFQLPLQENLIFLAR